MNDAEALPSEALRRKLAAIGIPPERHTLRELQALVPSSRGLDVDDLAEVVIYLVGKQVLELPPTRIQVSWGQRRCAQYGTQDELISLVVPWFREGIAANERCVWLVSSPQAITEDRLELIDPADWGDSWEREESRALAQGYSGLRVCADMRTLHERAPGRRSRQLCTHQGAS